MNYAVFRDGDRISRPFQTEGDAWDCANDAGELKTCRAAVEQFRSLMATAQLGLATPNL